MEIILLLLLLLLLLITAPPSVVIWSNLLSFWLQISTSPFFYYHSERDQTISSHCAVLLTNGQTDGLRLTERVDPLASHPFDVADDRFHCPAVSGLQDKNENETFPLKRTPFICNCSCVVLRL